MKEELIQSRFQPDIRVHRISMPIIPGNAGAIAGHSYSALFLRKALICLGLLAAVLVLFAIDLATGPSSLSFTEVTRVLLGLGAVGVEERLIIWEMRLPIALMAVLVGASLGLAGMEMQTILDNPLASPFTLGISSAAAFGAALSLLVPAPSFAPWLAGLTTPFFAFAFSLASALLIYGISKVIRERSTILLMGIAVNFLFSSLNAAIQYFVSDQVLRTLTNWSQGSILGATYREIGTVATALLLSIVLLLRDSWRLTALAMGDSTAQSLGVRVQPLRARTLVITALITSIAVCFVGTIGFVGLVAPYLAKALVGEEQRFLIPASLMTGALFLSVSSVASKSLLANGQIPIGIITALIGVPFLMALALQGKTRNIT
jgi:iron complex transport system permease protein